MKKRKLIPDYSCWFCDGTTVVLEATPDERRDVMKRTRYCTSCRREQYTTQPLRELTAAQQRAILRRTPREARQRQRQPVTV